MDKGAQYTHINVTNELTNSAFNRRRTIRIHERRPTIPTVDMRDLVRLCCRFHKTVVKAQLLKVAMDKRESYNPNGYLKFGIRI